MYCHCKVAVIATCFAGVAKTYITGLRILKLAMTMADHSCTEKVFMFVVMHLALAMVHAYTPYGKVSYEMALCFDQSEMHSMQAGTLLSLLSEYSNARLPLWYVVHSFSTTAIAVSLMVYTLSS